jgi:hypothetical protein
LNEVHWVRYLKVKKRDMGDYFARQADLENSGRKYTPRARARHIGKNIGSIPTAQRRVTGRRGFSGRRITAHRE